MSRTFADIFSHGMTSLFTVKGGKPIEITSMDFR